MKLSYDEYLVRIRIHRLSVYGIGMDVPLGDFPMRNHYVANHHPSYVVKQMRVKGVITQQLLKYGHKYVEVTNAIH